MMMKRFTAAAAAMLGGATLALGGAAFAQTPAEAPAQSLSELLDRIRSDSRIQSAEAAQRLREFQQRLNEQSALLNQATAEFNALRAEGDSLTEQINANVERIIEIEEDVREAQGEFGEYFGVARQVAGDVSAVLTASISSADPRLADRADALNEVATSRRLPTREQLDDIWQRQIEEMILQRETSTFTAKVRNFASDGSAMDVPVTRIGTFIAFAEDGGRPRFVDYANVPGEVKVLERQPSGAIISAASEALRAGAGELTRAPIDPTSGALLSALVESPTTSERYHQGGYVGYAITALAVGAAIFGLLRLAMLFMTGASVSAQARRPDRPSKGNPLGRVMLVAEESRGSDLDTFELRMDDAIARQSSGLDFGLNFLKLAAAVSPLLGLLGTVIGMVITFQAITLFGAGDPRQMADGISTALVTTVLGLMAAIPLLFIHSFAASASRAVQQTIEEQAAGIIAEHAMRRAA